MALKCTIVSLVPFDINEEKPGLIPPRFHIPASDMKIPVVVHIGTADHCVYLDDARGYLRVRNAPDVIARSIVEDYISSQLEIGDDAKPALFWFEDQLNASEVLLKYKDLIVERLRSQKQWMVNICTTADKDWNQYHKHNVVSSFQRRCGEIIGWLPEQHEWMAPQTTMSSTTCPACNYAVPQGLSFCPNCKCIIDKEKYQSLEFAK